MRERRLALGASSNIGIYLLQPYIKAYFDGRQPPELHVHGNPVIADRLEASAIDIAVMEWWDWRGGYVAHPWRREELVVIVPLGHPWANRTVIPRTLLREQPLLAGEPGTGTGRILARYFGDELRTLQISMRLGSTEAVKQWVAAGLGMSLVLAGTLAAECRAGRRVAVPLEGQQPSKELYVIWRESLPADAPTRIFGEWLAANPLPEDSPRPQTPAALVP